MIWRYLLLYSDIRRKKEKTLQHNLLLRIVFYLIIHLYVTKVYFCAVFPIHFDKDPDPASLISDLKPRKHQLFLSFFLSKVYFSEKLCTFLFMSYLFFGLKTCKILFFRYEIFLILVDFLCVNFSWFWLIQIRNTASSMHLFVYDGPGT